MTPFNFNCVGKDPILHTAASGLGLQGMNLGGCYSAYNARQVGWLCRVTDLKFWEELLKRELEEFTCAGSARRENRNSTKHNSESHRDCWEQAALPAGQAWPSAMGQGSRRQRRDWGGGGSLNANTADLFIKEGAEEGDMGSASSPGRTYPQDSLGPLIELKGTAGCKMTFSSINRE